MPMCGFNEKMLEGLSKFHEGLMEAMSNKKSLEKERVKLGGD